MVFQKKSLSIHTSYAKIKIDLSKINCVISHEHMPGT